MYCFNVLLFNVLLFNVLLFNVLLQCIAFVRCVELLSSWWKDPRPVQPLGIVPFDRRGEVLLLQPLDRLVLVSTTRNCANEFPPVLELVEWMR